MSFSRENVVGIVDLETLNNPEIDELIKTAFERNKFGSLEKAELGKKEIFKKIWGGLEKLESTGRIMDKTIVHMVTSGRVVLIGLNDEYVVNNYITILRNRARESGITDIEMRGLATSKPIFETIDKVVLVVRKKPAE
jgi:hypothetical protein